MALGCWVICLWPVRILLIVVAATLAHADVDLDRDGLSDGLEQELLERFAPRFHVHRQDCDVLPAEFAAGATDPKALARNGVIYGRVAPARSRTEGAAIEIQYFHLWARDCGSMSHAFDIEHVTAYVRAGQADAAAPEWKAMYWYSAAHEDTLCDNSSGMRAVLLDAETKGPNVWVSKGKHASYLTRERCAEGCRADDCANAGLLENARIVNLGEAEAPLNGAVWTGSPQWNMRAKLLRADFDDAVLARMEQAGTLETRGSRPLKGVAKAGSETSGALSGAKRATSGKVRNAVRTAKEKTGWFLGLR